MSQMTKLSAIQQFNVALPQSVTTLVVPADDSMLYAEPQYLPTFWVGVSTMFYRAFV